jgi:abhydrolase domain-containing protein 17
MDKKTLKRYLIGEFSWKRLMRSILLIYGLLCFYGFFLTDRQIFRPQTPSYQDSEEVIKLNSTPEVKISAIYLPNPKAVYTILYSHGNAEDLGDIRPVLTQLQSWGFAVFSYDYQGYGTSQGKPSESAAYQDIEAAYNYLTQKLGISPHKIIVYGRSVGGGPSVELASRKPVAGLILQSTFISTFRTVTVIPIVPFDKFANLNKIKQVNCPILVMHGKIDDVIPFWHGEKLLATAKEPKLSLWVENANHNDFNDVAGQFLPKTLQNFLKLLEKPAEELQMF